MDLFTKLYDAEPDAKVEQPVRPWQPEKVPTNLKLITRTSLNTVRKRMDRLRAYKQLLVHSPKTIKAVVKSVKNKTGSREGTRFSGSIPSNNRVVESRVFQFEDIQNLRKLVPGATINDVLLTVCGGGVRKYLGHHGELPEESLNAVIPISLRKEEEIGKGGNKVSTLMPSIGTGESDPVKRMEKIHQSTSAYKDFSEQIGSRNMLDLLDVLPGVIMDTIISQSMKRKLADRIPAMHSGIAISNVPGPREARYFCGAQLVRQLGGGFIMDGMGLLLVVNSYGGLVTLTITSCPEMLPDPTFLAQCLEETFDELKAAL